MESNISRDHIALEAMKAILNKTIEMKKSSIFKVGELILPNAKDLAKDAYDIADAMIAERERRNSKEE